MRVSFERMPLQPLTKTLVISTPVWMKVWGPFSFRQAGSMGPSFLVGMLHSRTNAQIHSVALRGALFKLMDRLSAKYLVRPI